MVGEAWVIKADNFEVLTFDCYGTLIDWETGLWDSLRPVFVNHQSSITKEDALELYGELESAAERGEYRDYRSILRTVLLKLGGRLGFTPTEAELLRFSESVKDWPAFPDSASALRELKRRYKLAVISNIDNDLFAASAERLRTRFDWVITSQEVKTYKPSLNNFRIALERLAVPKNKVLHVAQSLFHDIVPAKALGLSTVWVNRRHDKEGFGATPSAWADADLEVPDLKSLAAKLAGG
jgi:2-haloacid dehalogenase